MKNKGFTLIEMLAVVIIIGIISIIAIPSVSKYIEESRKSAYVKTIKDTLASLGSNIGKRKLKEINRDTTYYIPNECIKNENGIAKSPYDEFDKAYIVAGFEGNNYSVYWFGRDKSGKGIDKLKKINEITEEDIKSDVSKESIDTIYKIGSTTQIMVLDSNDCDTFISV